MSYRCTICGESHDGLPDIAADRPDHWWSVPEPERTERIWLTSDLCVIDGKDYFIRGVVEIPIHEQAEPFGFGVWVSQKKDNFFAYVENWDSDEIGPFCGWLCTRIRYYSEDTTGLKTMAHFRTGGLRPSIELEPTDHPLAVDQCQGMTLAKAWEIAHYYTPK